MAGLRTVFEGAACTAVTTYIQSGNVVFTHAARSATALETDLEQRISAMAGFAVPVVLRTAKQMADVVRDNPFPKASGKALHVAFFRDKPVPRAGKAIDGAAFAPEQY